MASTLDRVKNQSIGTSATTLTTGTKTGPASGKVWNIPRLYITNIHASATPIVTITHVTGATTTTIATYKLGAKGASSGVLVLENIVLLNGDSIQVTSDTAASIDVFGSIVEEDA